jgi:hypothetical protein
MWNVIADTGVFAKPELSTSKNRNNTHLPKVASLLCKQTIAGSVMETST